MPHSHVVNRDVAKRRIAWERGVKAVYAAASVSERLISCSYYGRIDCRCVNTERIGFIGFFEGIVLQA